MELGAWSLELGAWRLIELEPQPLVNEKTPVFFSSGAFFDGNRDCYPVALTLPPSISVARHPPATAHAVHVRR
ncbi:hypothetical protein C1888_24250 [Pseudomonas sp. GW531-T4]|nr:hypothetical protein C1888_24250 [Pseudomonas sp. GW531-T4]